MNKCLLGKLLKDRLKKAQKELAEQNASFSSNQVSEIPKWKKQVDDFEKGISTDNPYALLTTGLCAFAFIFWYVLNGCYPLGPSLQDVRLELLKEEHERERAARLRDDDEEEMDEGDDGGKAAGNSQTEFMCMLIELEDAQCVDL